MAEAPARRSARGLVWSLAAVTVLAAIVWGFHLRGATSTLDVSVSYRPQVRASLRTNTDLNVPLANQRLASCLLCHIGPSDPGTVN